MKTLVCLLVTALALTATFLSCKPGSDHSTRVESKASSRDLENKIIAMFNKDDQIRAADLSVVVEADKNEVTLSGTVQSEALRTKAIELAKAAEPGLAVNDAIDVGPRLIAPAKRTEELAKNGSEKAQQGDETADKRVEDARLHGKILAKFFINPKTPVRNISVAVMEGVVTLRGRVETAEAKAEAQRLAHETEGVKRVDNQLKVSA